MRARGGSDTTPNAFSNPGFLRPLATMDIRKGADCTRIVDCPDMPGGKALCIRPDEKGWAACTVFEKLEPGTWIVTAQMRGATLAELAVRRSSEDGVAAYCNAQRDAWRTYAGKNTCGDGLNLVFRGINVGTNGLHVGNVRLVKVADPDPRKSRGVVADGAFDPRAPCAKEEIAGETVLVNRTQAYYFAECPVRISYIRPQDTLRFTARAGVPAGETPARLAAFLLQNDGKGGTRTIASVFLNRQLAAGRCTEVTGSVPGKAFKAMSGSYRLFFYTADRTGTVGVSRVEWMVEPGGTK